MLLLLLLLLVLSPLLLLLLLVELIVVVVPIGSVRVVAKDDVDAVAKDDVDAVAKADVDAVAKDDVDVVAKDAVAELLVSVFATSRESAPRPQGAFLRKQLGSAFAALNCSMIQSRTGTTSAKYECRRSYEVKKYQSPNF
jgi:hypothetical protein